MYTLEAIADFHPITIISLLTLSVRRFMFQEDAVLDHIENSLTSSPQKIVEGNFWEEVSASAIGLYKDIHGPSYQESECSLIKDTFSLAALFYKNQIDGMQRKDLIYHEGRRHGNYAGIYLESIGKEVVYLDEDNPYYSNGQDSYENQRRRETFWITDKIKADYSINNAILLAGAHHIHNNYGLMDLLNMRRIKVDVVQDLRQLMIDTPNYQEIFHALGGRIP